MNLKHIPTFNTISFKSILLVGMFFLLCFNSFSQTKPTQITDNKGGKLINIRHAKRLTYDSNIGVDARRLIGDVECEHEGAGADREIRWGQACLTAQLHHALGSGSGFLNVAGEVQGFGDKGVGGNRGVIGAEVVEGERARKRSGIPNL